MVALLILLTYLQYGMRLLAMNRNGFDSLLIPAALLFAVNAGVVTFVGTGGKLPRGTKFPVAVALLIPPCWNIASQIAKKDLFDTEWLWVPWLMLVPFLVFALSRYFPVRRTMRMILWIVLTVEACIILWLTICH